MKKQNKLPFTWRLHRVGLSAGHQCFGEVWLVPLSSDQFSAFSWDISSGNPLTCLEHPPGSSVLLSPEAGGNFKCYHEEVAKPAWGKLVSRAVLLAEAGTEAWILTV